MKLTTCNTPQKHARNANANCSSQPGTMVRNGTSTSIVSIGQRSGVHHESNKPYYHRVYMASICTVGLIRPSLWLLGIHYTRELWYADSCKSFWIHHYRMVFLCELVHMGIGWDIGFDDESMSCYINVHFGENPGRRQSCRTY